MVWSMILYSGTMANPRYAYYQGDNDNNQDNEDDFQQADHISVTLNISIPVIL